MKMWVTMGSPDKPRWSRWILIAMLLVAYLNIGWAIGTYHLNYIVGQPPRTFWQSVWCGGFQFWESGIKGNPLVVQRTLMLTWPVWIVVAMVTWLIYFVYYSISYLLWLIFAGGFAKLLGVG